MSAWTVALGSGTPDVTAAIPSPPVAVWHLGPFPLRAYALAILAGIALALWLTTRRWVQRGGRAEDVTSIAYWAVPFGILGGRLYHVISSPDAYFGAGGDPVKALAIWEGGLGIWGAVALGALGAYIGARRAGASFVAFADAAAPAVLLAQAVGRLGNWFNQELFGGPTTLPWGLRVDPDVAVAAGQAPGTLFHPTFLYELLWNVACALLLLWIDRRVRLRPGQMFWLYVLLYTSGRVWIELLRVDPAEIVLGLRLNVWTSIVLGLAALVAVVLIGRRPPGVAAPREALAAPRDGLTAPREAHALDGGEARSAAVPGDPVVGVRAPGADAPSGTPPAPGPGTGPAPGSGT